MATRNGIKGKKLYQILVVGVIFTVVAVGGLAFWGVREVRRDAAAVAVESAARGISGAVTVLVNAISRSNEEFGDSFLASLKPDALRQTFTKVLKKHTALTGVMISDSKGLLYMLTRRQDGMYEVVPGRGPNASVVQTVYHPDGRSKQLPTAGSGRRVEMDDMLAGEYAHLKPEQVNWRSSYRFYQEGESWLTASTLVESDGHNYMVSYVFPVDTVVRRLDGAEKGGAEKVFLFWESGKVLPLDGELEGAIQGDRASSALESRNVADPVISRASELLSSDKRNRMKPFFFEVDKEMWWSYVLPLSVFGDTMSLGVAIPRKNIVSTLTSDTFLQVTGGMLVMLAAIALYVLYKNRARIEAMGLKQKMARSPEDVLRLIADGESGILEFKQTLRFNLKSGKNGKEIEHASLKSVAGFMNSEGGTLLVGIADNGAVTGFKEDKFGNADKAMLHFNNLVNQSIGAEFSRYLDTAIIEVQGEEVLRVFCLPAAVPAILKQGQTEEFYVRSGPASRQLTISQFYEWLQNH